jgi:hypothetical protein
METLCKPALGSLIEVDALACDLKYHAVVTQTSRESTSTLWNDVVCVSRLKDYPQVIQRSYPLMMQEPMVRFKVPANG